MKLEIPPFSVYCVLNLVLHFLQVEFYKKEFSNKLIDIISILQCNHVRIESLLTLLLLNLFFSSYEKSRVTAMILIQVTARIQRTVHVI